ncbi:glycosyl transferase [Rhizobium cremeum]|uniref:O-linked N-acetylglucosamine transferase, SPINDLY family protein n=1 Tax=Rhizobium cremeum TaxID=2813827 RepID=UPI000DDC8D1B|nr:glycosyl transferase [Rhizobium cremeum]MCJ7997049.1 glycosyl transferase [Rhizobium cremeum]MCJ8002267.1 glycosyl transferase [Rhizobium cremeum]
MNEITYAAASKQYRTGHYTASLSTLNRLLDVQRDARTYTLLAKTLLQLGLKQEAANSYKLAAEQGGQHAEENISEAIKLYFACGEKDRALALANSILSRVRRQPDLAYIVSSLLLERQQARLARVFKDLLIKSDVLEHMQLGARISLNTWDVFDPSDIETARVLLSRLPRNQSIRLMYLTFCREHSKFDSVERHQPLIDAAIAEGDTSFIQNDGTFFNLHWTGDEHLNQLARSNTPFFSPEITKLRRQVPHSWSSKIRIGYVSSDLFDKHATMKLIRRVLELHDRDRFEVTLFCHTDPEMLKLNEADRSLWGDVVTIRDMDDAEAIAEIRKRGIDILVDLKGHTVGNRTALFNRAAAPIQVAWLGFPGSTVNVDLDYAIGDKFVLPDSSKPHYYEKFCRLPETYQPNDPVNRPLAKQTSKKDVGLPEDAFVFASFNANRKITPPMIEMWATILKKVPNSVIWILRNNKESQTNITSKLLSCGIAAKRIFFMQKLDFELHLNRITAADVGLDTFPVNGHTTTSEQLWAGLPVLTIKGTNFASRVSESLLHAIGLPELIAEDNDDYMRKAIELAEQPERLKAYRQRLEDNRLSSPLFDAERFCRHLETAYQMMVDRAKQGLEPDHLDVPCLPPRDGAFMVK